MFKPFETFEVITAILKPLSLIIEKIYEHILAILWIKSKSYYAQFSCLILFLGSDFEAYACWWKRRDTFMCYCGTVHYAVQGGSNF